MTEEELQQQGYYQIFKGKIFRNNKKKLHINYDLTSKSKKKRKLFKISSDISNKIKKKEKQKYEKNMKTAMKRKWKSKEKEV